MSLLRGVKPTASRIRTAATRASAAAFALLCIAGARGAEAPPAPTPPVAAATPDAASPAAASRVDLQASFRREFDAKNYDAATTFARQYADLTEKEVGTKGDDLQVALMNLATTQFLAGDYVSAETTFLRVIELAEASARPRVERLARANAGLAATYYAGRRFDLAVSRFQRAVAYHRRSEGLLSESQLPLLDKFSNALTELGRYEEALKVQEYTLRIAQRKYGERDPRIAPTLEKIGRWYAKVGRYDLAQNVLRHTVDIVSDAEGENSPNLISPLMAIAECSRRQLTDPAELARATTESAASAFYQDPSKPPPFSPTATAGVGQKALDRAVAIATGRPDPVPQQVADVRTQYGDWFQVRGQPEKALPQYLEAWKAGAQVPYKGKTLADALFATPVLLNYTRPSGWDRYSGRPVSEITLKVALLESTVDADGRTSGPRLIDDSGDKRRGEQALKALSTARYRPRFENGQPVATPGVQFTQVFQVLLPTEAPPAAPGDGAPATPATDKPTTPAKDSAGR